MLATVDPIPANIIFGSLQATITFDTYNIYWCHIAMHVDRINAYCMHTLSIFCKNSRILCSSIVASTVDICMHMHILSLTLIYLSSQLANYRFTACGSRNRKGPKHMECIEHYCNSGSLVCDHLLNEGTRGSQIFFVPRSGNYTVTIAGASGGHGVCSNHSGLGVIARGTVRFRRGEKLRILVGQQGDSVCDGHQDKDICQLSNDTEACESSWNTMHSAENFIYNYDGGGGGGGASLLEPASTSQLPIVISPGGGAIYNFDTLYMNHTNGKQFKTASDYANGTAGKQRFTDSAKAGAGYFEGIKSVPRPLSLEGFGGSDCVETTRQMELLFPHTHGGFGGGGGGCDGGGGGGGYTGGSIIAKGATIPGEGGYSWPDPPWPLVEYNDGDGYVELFLESCGCTYNCIIDDQTSFECSCPSNTTLALNGLLLLLLLCYCVNFACEDCTQGEGDLYN